MCLTYSLRWFAVAYGFDNYSEHQGILLYSDMVIPSDWVQGKTECTRNRRVRGKSELWIRVILC